MIRRNALRLLGVLGLTATAACSSSDTPTITEFTATPPSVAAGERTTLAWTVENSDSVTVTNVRTGMVIAESADLTGSITTGVLRENTAFTLVATNAEGSTTQSLTVMVNAVGAPVVDTFAADPTTIDPGQTSQLTWATSNATSVTISGGGTDVVSAGDPGGMVDVSPDETTTYTLVANGDGGQTAMAMVTVTVNGAGRPTIRGFMAVPNPIDPGDSSTLSWDVTDADTIVITDVDDNEVFSGGDAMGSTMVTPGMTTTYTLTATNDAGMSTETVTVNVNPPQGAQIGAFVANPATIMLSQSSELQWTATNADRVEIFDADDNMVHMDTNLMGTFMVSPLVTTEYRLEAISGLGNATAMTTVTVSASAPVINDFSATPNPVAVGSTTTLSWDTLGADTVRVMRGNTLETESTMAAGTIQVPVTATSTTFTLMATNATGGNMASVIVYGQATPIIDALDVTPASFRGAVTATVSWSVRNVANLELLANGVAVPGFPGVSTSTSTIDSMGSFGVQISATTEFRLVASSLAGMSEQTVTAFAEVLEMEPNNDAANALPYPVSGAPAFGEINPGDDVDYYAVTVPQGGFIRAFTDDGMGVCPFDTNLTLTSTDGVTQLVFDDDGGVGTCSSIDPITDPAASNLDAGTYFIVVGSYQANTGNYVLTVEFGGPDCGNGVPEMGEQCDDGNLMNGDGCDAMCVVEPAGVYAAPGPQATFTDAISVVGEQDLYRVDVSADTYLTVETFGDAAAGTCGFDTVLRLFASDGTTELGVDDEGGVGSCSRIDSTDSFALLMPGTYYVRVEEFLNNGTIASYDIVFDSAPANVCGNGILEGAEQCDDGNTVPGDGCDAACNFTGVAENEAGGNNAFDGAGVVTVTSSVVLSGALTPAGDADWWAITVPQGYSVDAYLTVDSYTTCPTSPEGRLNFYDTDGSTLLATDDNDGPQGNCGRVFPGNDVDTVSLTAGTYYFEVEEDSSTAAAVTQYFLHVTLIAPACGNGILEGGEQCDDGNAVPGDGCNATCGFEPVATFSAPGAITLVPGSIMPATEVDVVEITVTADTYLFAETFTSTTPPSCNVDTRLRLFQSDGTTLIGEDDFDGINSCSQINASVDAFAQLSAGTYYLTVEEDGRNATIASYVLGLFATPVGQCGNLVVEGTETCDDGNTTGGDGCDATCQVEPVGAYTAPGMPMTFAMQAIDPVGEQDVYQITVTSTTYVSIETFEDAQAMTCSGDHFLRLFDGMGNQLGTDDDDGVGLCSLIGPPDSFARLGPGTYFAQVEELGNNSTIARYDIVFSSTPADVCGNGVVETGIGEICDDGNTTPGDGCDATCQLEGNITVESEPNDDFMTADASGLTMVGTQSVNGVITAGGDSDWWSFEVPTGGGTVDLITYEVAGSPTVCPTIDTEIWVYDSTGTNQIANNDDIGFPIYCSQLQGLALTAGVYYVRVEFYSPSGSSSDFTYYMDISVQ